MSLEKRLPLSTRTLDEVIAFRREGPVRLSRLLAESTALADRLPKKAYTVNLQSDRYRFMQACCATLINGGCILMPPNRLPGTRDQLSRE